MLHLSRRAILWPGDPSPYDSPVPPRRPVRSLVAVVTLAVALGACTGGRPSLSDTKTEQLGGDAGIPTGDPAVDAVLTDLESPLTSSFTLTYTILRKLGNTSATATVSRGPMATSVTVGDVRFLQSDEDHTCVLTTKACESTINDARISDLGISSAFWRDSPARALRVTYSRRATAATKTDATIAGQAAHCVDVPVGTGTERYCSLATGAMARWETAYHTIELTAVEPNLRQELFALPIGDAPISGG